MRLPRHVDSGRSWLKLDHEKKAMSCTLCKKHKICGQNGPLTWAGGGGCKTLHLDKVSEHENNLASTMQKL